MRSYHTLPATLMRGGTSKGLYIDKALLPHDVGQRDRVLLSAMGSPDPRQIDGVGGAHPLTSKIALISKSDRPGADVDYLFLQVAVDAPSVSGSQNCGNILSGVGPWAIEQGLVKASSPYTDVRIFMENTGGLAIARIQTPNGQVTYEGDAQLDGVPGCAAPVMIEFVDIAGANCGKLFPTGNRRDVSHGVELTCIDNGMPVVVLRATDLGITGHETPKTLETNSRLIAKLEAIRLDVGARMNLGDVGSKTVPKMCLVSRPKAEGVIHTRTFIPHRVHLSIGVLGAVSVATACAIDGTIAEALAVRPAGNLYEIEHPAGAFAVELDIEDVSGSIEVKRAALLRSARALFEGNVLVPRSIWGAS